VPLIKKIMGRKGSLSCNSLSSVDLVSLIVMATTTTQQRKPYCENVAAERYVA
jgi:hypothetical protein